MFKKKKIEKKDLERPVQAGDNTMFGPALIHELPVQRELCSGLNFTGERKKKKNKAGQINNKLFFKNQLHVLKAKAVQLLPLLLLQVTATVVKEEVHVLG